MSTYASLHFHIVFCTKHRTNFIHRTWADRLNDYLGGTVKSLDAFPQGIGGVEDHVHLLVGMKQTTYIPDFMRELKKGSSRWVRHTIGMEKFAWQEGYAVFSVSATARESVRKYIGNQREHHQGKSYRQELVEMLQRAEVEFDPTYLE